MPSFLSMASNHDHKTNNSNTNNNEEVVTYVD